MDINIKTGIDGYFSYKVYREAPDNIVYESPLHKNLIVRTGLDYLYDTRIPDVMKILDIGNSDTPPTLDDTGLKGPTFPNSNIFNDLSAIYLTGGPVEGEQTSEYTAFFRTKTTSSPIVLKEFVIKPGPNKDAFARQVFTPLTLQSGDGIEFTYRVRVNWECSQDATLKLFYTNLDVSEDIEIPNEQLPLIWNSVELETNDKLWTGLTRGDNTLVAVATDNLGNVTTDSNIIFSNDFGETWNIASPADSSFSLYLPLNDVAFGFLNNGAGGIDRYFVAVGANKLTYSNDSGATWQPGNFSSISNWTSISFGNINNTPRFVTVANSGAYRVMTSTNINTWTNVSGDVVDNINWSAITCGSDHYVAVADSGSHRIAYSTNGVDWLSARAPALNKWSDISYNPDRDIYVAVSRNSSYSSIMYASGGDITKWYPVESPYESSWNGITYGNGVFVAVGESALNSRAIYSSDGIEWKPVDFISFTEEWKSVEFINNTFVAIASSFETIDKPFAISRVERRGARSIDVGAKISLITIPDKVYNKDFYMHTLRGFDMPQSCLIPPTTAENLLYSTTLPFNSFVKNSSTHVRPNTGIGSYIFDRDTGHGVIKNLLIADNFIAGTYSAPGVWAIEINSTDSNITSPIVYTGTLDDIVELPAVNGSITRSISSTSGVVLESNLQFNITHTWGPSAYIPFPVAPTIPSGTTSDTNYSFVDIFIRGWRAINIADYKYGNLYIPLLSESVVLVPEVLEILYEGCSGPGTPLQNTINLQIKTDNIQSGPTIQSGKTDILALPAINIDYASLPSAQPSTAESFISLLTDDSSNTPLLTSFSLGQIEGSGLKTSKVINEINWSARARGVPNIAREVSFSNGIDSNGNFGAIVRILFDEINEYSIDYVSVQEYELIPCSELYSDPIATAAGFTSTGFDPRPVYKSYRVFRPASR